MKPLAWSERVASQTSRDLPTPASATSATTCPWPARTRASARSIAARSSCRPTNGVSPRAADAWSRVRAMPAPISSYTSTGCSSPFTVVGPSGLTSMNPSASARVDGLSRTVPAFARPSIREARWTVWPIAV